MLDYVFDVSFFVFHSISFCFGFFLLFSMEFRFLLHSVNYCSIRDYTFAHSTLWSKSKSCQLNRSVGWTDDEIHWTETQMLRWYAAKGNYCLFFSDAQCPSVPHHTFLHLGVRTANAQFVIGRHCAHCSFVCIAIEVSVKLEEYILVASCAHLWPCAAAACCRCTLRRSKNFST